MSYFDNDHRQPSSRQLGIMDTPAKTERMHRNSRRSKRGSLVLLLASLRVSSCGVLCLFGTVAAVASVLWHLLVGRVQQHSLFRVESSSSSSSSSSFATTAATKIPKPKFPSLPDTLEMARLSLLVYTFRHEEQDDTVCQRIARGNFTLPIEPSGGNNNNNNSNQRDDDDEDGGDAGRDILPDLVCHWYYHDRHEDGTQVMIVSSKRRNHLTVVFAGTDDLQTSLVDTDVRWEVFGKGTRHELPKEYRNVRVHSGFDHAVFRNGVVDQILQQLEHLRAPKKNHGNDLSRRRLFVTGHSLGAAAAVLTSMALVEHYYNETAHEDLPSTTSSLLSHKWRWPHWRHHHHHHDADKSPPSPEEITSINFGCPRIGNSAYRRYFPHKRLQIWRIVLGWDLVPRLPDLFKHAGNTVQLSLEKETKRGGLENGDLANDQEEEEEEKETVGLAWPTRQTNKTHVAMAYYQHYGNATLGYAGVPLGWASRPYVWVPGALSSHHVRRYRGVLEEWDTAWVTEFVKVGGNNNDDDEDSTSVKEDDTWVDPPFDDFPGPTTS